MMGGPVLTHRRGAALAPVVVIVAVASLFLSGCGVPASTYCYVASSATVHAVDTGMSVAGDLYKQGKVSEAAKVKLVAAHDIYRPAAKAVVDGCQAIARDDKAGADVLIGKMQAAGQHVVELLVAVGVK